MELERSQRPAPLRLTGAPTSNTSTSGGLWGCLWQLHFLTLPTEARQQLQHSLLQAPITTPTVEGHSPAPTPAGAAPQPSLAPSVHHSVGGAAKRRRTDADAAAAAAAASSLVQQPAFYGSQVPHSATPVFAQLPQPQAAAAPLPAVRTRTVTTTVAAAPAADAAPAPAAGLLPSLQVAGGMPAAVAAAAGGRLAADGASFTHAPTAPWAPMDWQQLQQPLLQQLPAAPSLLLQQLAVEDAAGVAAPLVGLEPDLWSAFADTGLPLPHGTMTLPLPPAPAPLLPGGPQPGPPLGPGAEASWGSLSMASPHSAATHAASLAVAGEEEEEEDPEFEALLSMLEEEEGPGLAAEVDVGLLDGWGAAGFPSGAP